jgi:hypothetical protein
MTKYFLILIVFLLPISLCGQEKSSSSISSKYKLVFSFGFSAINPEDINEHISISNSLFTSTTRTIKSAPEFSATFVIRPSRDDKIILLRGSYISIERVYRFLVPETIDTSTITGYTSGTITETYTAYPFSIGAGLTSSTFDSQIQIEFIFGLGFIEEEGSYISSTGRRTSYIRSLFSPGYGLRIAGNTAVKISDNIGLNFELAYRFLSFHEYEDETTTQPADIIFSYSGMQGMIGLSIIF